MHFRLVLIYDLLEDRRRDDINNIFLFYHIKQRFHVAIGLYCNKSQMTSKCGENIGDTGHNFFLFFPHFDLICDLLLNICMET